MIELLVAIAIMGILAVTSVPSITKSMRENDFNTDKEEVWSILNEARNNALSSKRCEGGGDAGEWIVKVNSTNSGVVLSCETDTRYSSYSYERKNVGTVISIIAGGDITFLPQSAQVKLSTGNVFTLEVKEASFDKCVRYTLNQIAGFFEKEECPPSL